jgi:23S rRNA (cytidine1920-2'-O)/16S rRNA (cytidine1409-2'-O)-methyltransferase
MPRRVRIDRLLVERGLLESRAKAQAAIAAGRVRANDMPVRKASEEILDDAALVAEPEHPWVSRGGIKLASALQHFQFDPAGRVCLDVGASTGGFTEVLLARGARRVYAVDVGRGQLHARLRGRAEVVSFEQLDIRSLDAALLDPKPDFICVDVSFISVKLVLGPALALARAPASLLALIKPQFESGGVGLKKGIVRDPLVQAAACEEGAAVVTSLGWRVAGIMVSPLPGREGNREFFIGACLD